MRYDIRLKIEQEYGAPTDSARLHLRLLPTTRYPVQTLLSGRLESDPAPAARLDRVDFFGNPVTEMTWSQPLDSLTFHLRAIVDRTTGGGRLDLSSPLASLAGDLHQVQQIGPGSPLHFRTDSPRVAYDDAIASFARDQIGHSMTAQEAVKRIGQAIHREMAFDAEATDVTTTPADAFKQKRGVCQDFTHVMIAALRAVGIPAGYVSGFLRTIPPKGQERLAGADAMHAWVRAWVGGETGWTEYDPTNDCDAGGDHILVATGRDYSDVAPVKGALRTYGDQKSGHSVDVIPLETV